MDIFGLMRPSHNIQRIYIFSWTHLYKPLIWVSNVCPKSLSEWPNRSSRIVLDRVKVLRKIAILLKLGQIALKMTLQLFSQKLLHSFLKNFYVKVEDTGKVKTTQKHQILFRGRFFVIQKLKRGLNIGLKYPVCFRHEISQVGVPGFLIRTCYLELGQMGVSLSLEMTLMSFSGNHFIRY